VHDPIKGSSISGEIYNQSAEELDHGTCGTKPSPLPPPLPPSLSPLPRSQLG
jgi:hypothetical protein